MQMPLQHEDPKHASPGWPHVACCTRARTSVPAGPVFNLAMVSLQNSVGMDVPPLDLFKAGSDGVLSTLV